jgi:polar amino acid transport system substrate-binding protein
MRALLLFLVSLLFCGGCERAGSNRPLRVGMEMNYPPFEMRDAQGQPAGVSVDLARALAASLGRPIEFSDIPFNGLIPALKTGQIDLVISSMTATDERRQSIDFEWI